MWKAAVDYGEPAGHGEVIAEGYTIMEVVNRIPSEVQQELMEHSGELGYILDIWYEVS